MPTLDEPTAFRQLSDSLDLAADAAGQIALLRDDMRWETIKRLLQDMKSKTFELRLRSVNDGDLRIK